MNILNGNKIRLLRKRNNLTIQELAKLVELSPSAIGMYERGVRKPELSLIVKLSALFNVNVSYFYREDSTEQGLLQQVDELIKKEEIHFFTDDEKIKNEVLKRANGYCELCNKFAPFITNDGVPYLELCEIESVGLSATCKEHALVALCPNCNRKLQLLNLKGDRTYLINKINKR